MTTIEDVLDAALLDVAGVLLLADALADEELELLLPQPAASNALIIVGATIAAQTLFIYGLLCILSVPQRKTPRRAVPSRRPPSQRRAAG